MEFKVEMPSIFKKLKEPINHMPINTGGHQNRNEENKIRKSQLKNLISKRKHSLEGLPNRIRVVLLFFLNFFIIFYF